ncbi:hypothetical protein HPY86_08305 [candidate division WOR-3 bacterium]|nr:hypothetical protein [candidate division WOR-3 bacterium]
MLVAQGTSTARYYVAEFTDDDEEGVCVVEVYGEPDSTVIQADGLDFQEMTLDEFHAAGYLTATEQLAQANPSNISTNIVDHSGYKAISWILIYPDPQRPYVKRRINRGSKTIRPTEGYCKVRGRYRKFAWGDTSQLLSIQTAEATTTQGDSVLVWWDTGHSINSQYTWNQHGWHWWVRETPAKETDVWRNE